MKEIKKTMNNNFLEATLTNFSESLHELTVHLEEHKLLYQPENNYGKMK